MIYLDNAATTFPKPEAVYIEMDRVNRNLSVNTGRGSYRLARTGSELIDETKETIHSLLHTGHTAEVVFTSSVTHAINQVLRGIELAKDSVIYETPYEHNAVARTVESICQSVGCTSKLIPLKQDLSIDIEKTRFQFSEVKPAVVVINAVSNVTGYVLPIKEMIQEAKAAGAIVVIDAAQAAGLIPLDFQKLGADVICFAGHKTLYGPFGIAGFVISHKLTLRQVFTGGTGSNSLNLAMPEEAPARYEASSPNIVAISGLNAAMKTLEQPKHYEQIRYLTDYLIKQLKMLPNIVLAGVFEDAAVGENLGIVSFYVNGYQAYEVGEILDKEFDIAVRTGYHCAPFIHNYIHSIEWGGTVRVGLGIYNTTDDIDQLIDALDTL